MRRLACAAVVLGISGPLLGCGTSSAPPPSTPVSGPGIPSGTGPASNVPVQGNPQPVYPVNGANVTMVSPPDHTDTLTLTNPASSSTRTIGIDNSVIYYSNNAGAGNLIPLTPDGPMPAGTTTPQPGIINFLLQPGATVQLKIKSQDTPDQSYELFNVTVTDPATSSSQSQAFHLTN